jgi:PKD repeat protein
VPWTPSVMDGYVRTFADMGNFVISGGSFTTVRKANTSTNIARSNIVAFEKGSGNILPFNPSINGEVFKILPTGDGQTVYVAGGFSQVNGQTVRSIVKLDATSGQRVTQFNPPAFDGRIHDLFLRNGKLYVTGRFSKVANEPHTLLAALDPVTGAVDPTVKVTFSEPRRNGTLTIYDADITPDGSKLVAIGNFTKINGLTRYQIGVIDLTTSPPSVANWHTNQYGDGCSSSFESYMRGVDISPDGSYFVVVTTGAYNRTYLCDVAARWDLNRTGSNLMPEWTNYTGGDTLTAVAITDDVVYVGGHQNYMNNPYAGDAVGNGAVPRDGLAALDPRAGATLSWNPSRERGWGVYGFQVTADGLWVGSDTVTIAGQPRPRQALLPLVGGKELPTEHVGSLPANVYSLGLMQGGSGTQLDRVARHPMAAGGTTGSQTISAGTSQWRNLRGAFMVDGKLYTGWSDQSFKVQNFDGTTFGPQSTISLRLDPSSASLNRFASQDLSTITGMFYDRASGRIYFTKRGTNSLFWRSFSPESNIVGAERYTSDTGSNGLNWSTVQSMFLADGKLYTANTSGVLSRRDWNPATGTVVPGTAVNVSGPNIDGHDWRARDAFLFAQGGVTVPNVAPVPQFTSSCTGVSCTFDASASSDSDGTIASYVWDFGDGTAAGVGVNASHVYTASGDYTVTLTVTDDDGDSASLQQQVSVVVPNQAPVAAFTQSCNGLSCSFDGTGSSDPDGTIASYSWTFGDGGTSSSATPTHEFAAAGTYEVSLTVTDDDGATTTKTTNVTVIDPNVVPTVAFRAANGSDANTNSPAVTIPASVQAGDLLVLVATQNVAGATVTAPAGWTLLDKADSTANTMQSLVWTRTATAADAGATVRLTSSEVAKTSLQVVAYSGAAGVSASAKAIETVQTTQHAAPGVVVSTPGSAVLSYWSDKSGDNTGWTLPADVTGRAQTVGSGSGRIVASLAEAVTMTPGAVGPKTATAAGAANKKAIMWSIVVAPDTSAPNLPPTVSFTRDCNGLTCSFDGTGSSDPDGTIASYSWAFGDGGSSSSATPTHTFPAAGTYDVTLTVTDDSGASNSTTSSVTVAPAAAVPVAFRAANGTDANATQVNVTVPGSVQAGDVLVLIATLNNTDATVTGPAGWTLVDSVSSTSITMQSYVWTKVAGAGDAGSNVRVTNSVTSKTSVQLLAYSNAQGVGAAARSVESVAQTTHTTPTVPVTAPGSTLISYWADKTNDNTGWTLPLGVESRHQTVGSASGHITAVSGDSGSLGADQAGAANRKAIMWSIVVAPSS